MAEIVIAGAGGMLGTAFADALGDAAMRIGRAALDLANIPAIQDVIARSGASIVVNCAADTDVEAAETAPDAAWQVNALLPGILGSACRRTGATLVHLSSTGAYGDWKETAYDEDDPLRPTTMHHRSKAAGEVAVRDSGCEHLIVRTGWLFGGVPDQPKNFVWKRILEAAANPDMVSDATQRGNPTATADLVRQVMTVIATGYRGTINAVSRGSATRYDYVARIVAASGLSCQVSPLHSPFVRAARVSPNEAAVNRRLQLLGLDAMPAWEDAIDRYVADLKAGPRWPDVEKRA